MTDKDILIQKYQSGKLNEHESHELEKLIASGEIQLEEIEEYGHVMEFLDASAAIDPSEHMDERFFSLLNSATVRNKKPKLMERLFASPFRWAIPLAVMILTFYVGLQFGSEKSQLAEAETSKDFPTELLATDNINKKISLVSNTTINEETDQKVIDALMFALNNDESTNVRLACINTLFDYSYLPDVRAGLISAISNQTSPLVLSNLAEAINASGNRLSPDDFKSRIKKEMPQPLRSLVEQSITNI